MAALVDRWKNDGISAGTFKNRMGAVRWMYGKVNKHFLVPRTNAELGIGNRQYVTNESKARELTPTFGDIDRIKSPHVRMSLELQRAFGMRREEALKIRPAWGGPGNEAGAARVVDEGGQAARDPDSDQASAGGA